MTLDGDLLRSVAHTVELVADCALDPQKWPAVCERIALLCESTGSGVCVHEARQNDHLFVYGYKPESLKHLCENYADSPMVSFDAVADLGEVSALSIADKRFSESRFYRDVLQPIEIRDIIWFPALRNGARSASLHASRHQRSPCYDRAEVEVFKLISPHVCRSLAVSDALDMRSLKAEMLERTLDKLLTGVFLTRHDGQVVYMNAAAERQINEGSAVRLVNNHLRPADRRAQANLSKAIESALSSDPELRLPSHSVAIPNRAGRGYIATCLPMERSERREVFASFAATCAVFMQDPQPKSTIPGEAFARLHGLTEAELRVLLALSQGLGGTQAAHMLGVSVATVRSHLQHIFSKTGASRQSTLLRLFHNSAPPVEDH